MCFLLPYNVESVCSQTWEETACIHSQSQVARLPYNCIIWPLATLQSQLPIYVELWLPAFTLDVMVSFPGVDMPTALGQNGGDAPDGGVRQGEELSELAIAGMTLHQLIQDHFADLFR